MKAYVTVLKLSLIVGAFYSIGCSNVGFGSENGSSSSQISSLSSDNGDAAGNLNQNGGAGGGSSGGGGSGGAGGNGGGGGGSGGGSASSVPSVHFVGPPCVIGTQCAAQFVLDHAMPQALMFHWRTNDTAYTLPPPAPGVIFGRPNYHYIPIAGDLTFAPGETTKTVYIQNINPDPTVAIEINVRMSGCVYNASLFNCADIFH